MENRPLFWLRRGMDLAQRSFVALSIVGTGWVLFNVGLFAYDSAKRRRVAAQSDSTNNNDNESPK